MVHWTRYAALAVAVLAAVFAAGQLTIAFLDRRDAKADETGRSVAAATSDFAQVDRPDKHRIFIGEATPPICGGAHVLTAEPYLVAGQPGDSAFLSVGGDTLRVKTGGFFAVSDDCSVKLVDVGQTNKLYTDVEVHFRE